MDQSFIFSTLFFFLNPALFNERFRHINNLNPTLADAMAVFAVGAPSERVSIVNRMQNAACPDRSVGECRMQNVVVLLYCRIVVFNFVNQ